MNEIKSELATEGIRESGCLPLGGFHADQYLAVPKSDDIGRTVHRHKVAVNCRDARVGNKDHVDLVGKSHRLYHFRHLCKG